MRAAIPDSVSPRSDRVPARQRARGLRLRRDADLLTGQYVAVLVQAVRSGEGTRREVVRDRDRPERVPGLHDVRSAAPRRARPPRRPPRRRPRKRHICGSTPCPFVRDPARFACRPARPCPRSIDMATCTKTPRRGAGRPLMPCGARSCRRPSSGRPSSSTRASAARRGCRGRARSGRRRSPRGSGP